MSVETHAKLPSVEEHQFLNDAYGFSIWKHDAAETGSSKGILSVCANGESKVIGMGLEVGDEGCYWQVTDVCVLPVCQRKFIESLMQPISRFLENLPATCYVTLLNHNVIPGLFEQFCFKRITADPNRMHRKQKKYPVKLCS